MKKISLKLRSMLALLLAATCLLNGCGSGSASDSGALGHNQRNHYTEEEALAELEIKLEQVDKPKTNQPRLYIDDSSTTPTSLASIDTFPLTVQGKGSIDIEIAAATELSAEAPDDLINVLAKKFNQQKISVNGQTASVSVRKITSGEVVTYMVNGDYRPTVYLPSFYVWADMLEAKGFTPIKLTDRMAGNTAGILMEKATHDEFVEKYGEVTVAKVMEASLAGDLTFGNANSYTSSTGLNMTARMLESFDPANPLSSSATQKLLEYQKNAPSVAYTTAVLQQNAINGVLKAMVMEEQAYINAPELRDFVYIPFGIRHDHPVYTFDYASEDEQAVAREFVKFCLSDEAQKIATSKGFNRHDDYVSPKTNMTGADYWSVQQIWKETKDGGKPILAVFVADVSGSMRKNGALTSLQKSLLATMEFINEENYIGLVSYSDRVYKNLEIAKFDATQQAYFAGAVHDLSSGGGTATYDAVLVALDMLYKKAAEVPDAQLMMFVLSDGEQLDGFELDKVIDIVDGLDVQIYTIGYNLDLTGERARSELQTLSALKEAEMIDAKSEDIVNQLRGLFNIKL